MRKRSSYRQKPVRLDTLGWIKAGLQKLTQLPDENVRLRIRNHDALRAISRGEGQRDEADILIAAMNMAEALAKLRLGEDWSAEIRAGQTALLSVCRRSLTTGRLVFTASELTAVNTAMEIHDAQLDACTVAELERALDIVERVKRSGHAVQIGATA